MTIHSIHKRQTDMPVAGFETTIPASEWLHMATGMGKKLY
jgi:hypothetical protein